MPRRDWTRDELLLAMNLYCQLPFGRLHKSNPDVIRLAGVIGRTPSSAAMKLVNLASLDPVHQERGVKGLSGASKGDRQIWGEFHDDWERLSAESEALREQRFAAVAGDSSAPPDDVDLPFAGETDATAVVRVRRAQRFFRRAVLTAYEARCCVTDIGLPDLLVASHIVPWSSSVEHRANPRNGLCLSQLHDAAFDRGLVTFDPEWRLVLSRELRDATTNETLNASFVPFEGRPLRLPERFRPESEFVSRHRQEMFRG
ncbi:HNH endonuclease [Planctellipticum variicoloris]|uniref:HNH endonuclease n=1 Tax=Planctellipticum variicoloris TaxID=3064265 RepID=UPI003013AF4F|nr:HNH endonuclease [Planctomycetaceae bacterium SH412]